MQHLVAMRKNCSWAIWRTDLEKKQQKNTINNGPMILSKQEISMVCTHAEGRCATHLL